MQYSPRMLLREGEEESQKSTDSLRGSRLFHILKKASLELKVFIYSPFQALGFSAAFLTL